MQAQPRLLSVATANPPERYTQEEVASRYRIDDPRVRALFSSKHIHTRHLYLPEPDDTGAPTETQGQLLQKHLRGAMEIGPQAVERCLSALGATVADVDYLCVTTTTGFLAPGLTAHLIRKMGFRPETQRCDIVGMGCNAGLNALGSVANWTKANPGRLALLVCIEICSASYVYDGTMRTGVVNSLFGDGAAALAVRTGEEAGPTVLGFESFMITDALPAMRFDWDDDANKFSFFLDPNIPYHIGRHVQTPVTRLLDRFGLKRRDISHWIVHSGGKKVVDAIKYNLGLSAHDVRHTSSVLRDFGNVSSASFLFSFRRLLDEGRVRPGDRAVMMTMGPGSQIETALLRF